MEEEIEHNSKIGERIRYLLHFNEGAQDHTNFETIANIINEATKELVNFYFSRQQKPEDYLI